MQGKAVKTCEGRQHVHGIKSPCAPQGCMGPTGMHGLAFEFDLRGMERHDRSASSLTRDYGPSNRWS